MLRILSSALRRRRRTVVIALVLGVIILILASPPHTVVRTLVRGHYSIHVRTDHRNKDHSRDAKEYFLQPNNSRQDHHLPHTQNMEKTVSEKGPLPSTAANSAAAERAPPDTQTNLNNTGALRDAFAPISDGWCSLEFLNNHSLPFVTISAAPP
ncbi:hypothetical protein ACOMHN_067119 [Nucella lapillus]